MIRRRRRAPLHVEALEGRRLLTVYADTFTIAATDAYASEANPADTATFRVTRNGDASSVGHLVMSYDTGAGSAATDDYTVPEPAVHFGGAPQADVTFAIGQTATYFTVVPRPDNRTEGTEAVTFRLSMYIDRYNDGIPATGGATATIADDPPVFTITASDAAAKEGSADTAAFVLTRSGGSTADTLFLAFTTNVGGSGLATPPGQAGADYSLAAPGLSERFNPGETSKTITLTALADNLAEGPETATLSLSNYSSSSGNGSATGTATATLADDPPRFTITATDATAKEADPTDTATFTVTRAGGDLSTAVQVNLAASPGGVGLATPPAFNQAGADYSLSSYDSDTDRDYLIFGPGVITRTITLTAIKDSLIEGPETATLRLASYESPAGLVPLVGSAVANIEDAVPTLRVVSVAYSGTGWIQMRKFGAGSYGTTAAGPGSGPTTPYANPGDTLIGSTVWRNDKDLNVLLNDPVAYVMGSTPQVLVTVQVVAGTLPAGTAVALSGVTQASTYQTTKATAQATGQAGELLTFQEPFTAALARRVDNTVFSFSWSADIGVIKGQNVGSSKTAAFITLGTPSGGGLGPGGVAAAKRLEYLTNDAITAATSYAVVAAVGPDLTAKSRFNGKDNFRKIGFDPFQVLDRDPKQHPQVDCVTLAELMKRGIDLLGVPGNESVVKYVYARHDSWAGLSSTAANAWETYTQGDDWGMLAFNSGGYNNWEGCCVWTGTNPATQTQVTQWWMGGGGAYKDTDFAVLLHWTQPNTVSSGNYQEFVDFTNHDRVLQTAVSYPTLPDVKNLTQAAALAEISRRGFAVPTINYVTTGWWQSYDGYAIRCYAPSGNAVVSPYEPLILDVYRYTP